MPRRALMEIALALAPTLTAVGCATAGPDGAPGDRSGGGDAPLSRRGDVFAGAPANETLPDEGKADAVYPSSHDALVGEQSPVKDQGDRGTCAVFAATALMEHLYIKAGADDPDFSEQFLQWSSKVEAGSYADTEGSTLWDDLAAIRELGVVAEEDWPYEAHLWDAARDPACGAPEAARPVRCFTNGDPPAAALEAPRHRLPRGRFLNTGSIKAHIAETGRGVGLALDVFFQAWNHGASVLPIRGDYRRQGYVLYPNDEDRLESQEVQAGHTVYVVGWDDDLEVPVVDADGRLVIGADGRPVTERGFYLFKNSWGTLGFGVDNPYGAGYGWLSMRYVEDYGSAYVVVGTVSTP